MIDGSFVANPTIEQMFSSSLDLIYVGTKKDMLMIEGSADQLPEDDFIQALEFGHNAIQPIITAIEELVSARRQTEEQVPARRRDRRSPRDHRARRSRPSGWSTPSSARKRPQRSLAVKMLKEEAKVALTAELGEGKFTDVDLNVVFEDLQYKAYRKNVLEKGVRADGRDAKVASPALTPKSAFSRACTAARRSNAATRRTSPSPRSGRRRKPRTWTASPAARRSKSFILHYNFPPFSVGETGRFGAPGRREIGHGALAERSLVPVLPPEDVFPYSIRVVIRNHGLERLDLDGVDLRRLSRADGRRRADHRTRRGNLLRSDDREATQTARSRNGPPSPTSSVRKITSATWTSSSPAPPKASRASSSI